jgi:hypothetical protein
MWEKPGSFFINSFHVTNDFYRFETDISWWLSSKYDISEISPLIS